MILQSRRGFITGLAALVAAPAVVRASSLMPIKAPKLYKSAIEIQQIMNQLLEFRMKECEGLLAKAFEDAVLCGSTGAIASTFDGLLSYTDHQGVVHVA